MKSILLFMVLILFGSNYLYSNNNTSTQENQDDSTEIVKSWVFAFDFGLNAGNVLEFNNPNGTDKKCLSLNTEINLGLNYKKEGSKFEMTNELHYSFGIQKAGLALKTNSQRTEDDLATLHDFSFGINKGNKLNINVILKSNTSIFTIFDGDYFKDINNLGRIQGFSSPYDIIVSPGLKYQPNDYFRFSLSPYSFQLYGIVNNEIASKGIFITDLDEDGNYKHFFFKRQGGAEANFWFDRKIKKWLVMQYRLSFSSDYFENFGKNCLMNGLFITKVKIIKDLYLTHKATLKSDLAVNFLKPYYNQTVMLSYSKSF
jgi:hypothetical protein